MNLAEALQYLQDLEVSDSSENDLEIEHQDITKIFIQPPLDSNGNNSDIDSGDEEDASIDNLSGNQLLAPASLVVKDVREGEIHVEQNIDQEEKKDDPASNCSGSGSNKRKTSIKVKNGKELAKKKAKGAKEIHVNRWQHNGIQNVEDLSSWTSPEPVRDLHDSPVTLFELFMTDKLIDHICKETNAYAAKKGNHTFKIEPNELKSFLAVLLLSGYIPYPRRSMYWEMSSDSRNTIVASLFTRNRFLDVLQYLHLADNNNLNPSDKFSKVNPLFKMINGSCLENFIPEKNVSIDESMVPYYGRHGCKQYIQNKPIKFGCKLWVAATPLG